MRSEQQSRGRPHWSWDAAVVAVSRPACVQALLLPEDLVNSRVGNREETQS